jgi:hypothetical protein
MLERMIEKRPQADRLLVAELYGEARHRTRWRKLSGDEEAAAVAEFRELAGGRADLLAEVAGILKGTAEGELDEPLKRQAAMLCRKAGADPEAIAAWIEGRAAPEGLGGCAAVLGRLARRVNAAVQAARRACTRWRRAEAVGFPLASPSRR